MSEPAQRVARNVLQQTAYLPDSTQALLRLKGLKASTIKMAKTLQSS